MHKSTEKSYKIKVPRALIYYCSIHCMRCSYLKDGKCTDYVESNFTKNEMEYYGLKEDRCMNLK